MGYWETRRDLIAIREHMNDHHGVQDTWNYTKTDPDLMTNEEGDLRRWCHRYGIRPDRPPETEAEWEVMRDAARLRQRMEPDLQCPVPDCPGLDALKAMEADLAVEYARVKPAPLPPAPIGKAGKPQTIHATPTRVGIGLGRPGG